MNTGNDVLNVNKPLLQFELVGEKPLCVDLDGTLVQTDLLWESLIVLLRQNPFYILLIPIWLCKGRAYAKRQISQRVALNPQTLPYNIDFLSYLRVQHEANRRLVLVTAADSIAAHAVAEHLKLFSQVIASDGNLNLKGHEKSRILVQQFGAFGYDYAGNSRADLPVWKGCHRAVVINANAKLLRKAAAVSSVERNFRRNSGSVRTWLKAIRVHQWVKNLLVFTPLVTSHQLLDLVLLKKTVISFFAFSFCASSVYVLNDLLDLHFDRLHPHKRKRPFASGELSIPKGLLMAAALLAGSAIFSLSLSPLFRLILMSYYGLTLAYSLSLKRKLLVDVFALSALYTIRVLAGGAVTGIAPSPWLLAFCLFFFVSLALTKRFTELLSAPEQGQSTLAGRKYMSTDLQIVGSLGTVSGFMGALVLALYINSPQVLPLYQSPALLWLLCPLILYWISRVWLLAYRGVMNADPITFAISDKISLATALCSAAIVMAAAHGLPL